MGQLEDILKHQNMVRNNIMKSFGAETSEDSLEKSFEDEVNPFEMEAYKSELTKAELDEFEKAKHQDGDMHPNGKWVWRASANGGKGDWRVAKPGGSKAKTGGGAAAATKTTAGDSKVAKFMDALKTVNSKYTDESKVSVMKTPKGNWEVSYDGHVVGTVTSSILSEKVAKDKGWIKDDDKKKPEKSSYESKEADAYDKGDGKVGNYPVPTHTSYPAANLYSRLKNNRHFGFKYGLPEEEIMKKLKDYKGNVKVSYHNNAGTSEIYRIKFL
jgi:hypothetical protein|nr:MAG TPA: hypothetical protein [Caudoviricetes sp.]